MLSARYCGRLRSERRPRCSTINSVLGWNLHSSARRTKGVDGETRRRRNNSPERSRTGRDLTLTTGADSAHFEVLRSFPNGCSHGFIYGIREANYARLSGPDSRGRHAHGREALDLEGCSRRPKTRASHQSVPVIPTLAKIPGRRFARPCTTRDWSDLSLPATGGPWIWTNLQRVIRPDKSRPAACRGMAGTVPGAGIA